MGILFEKKLNMLPAVTAILVCILMILFSDIAVLSAKKSIALWSGSVLPAMLPFFICVNFMTGIGIIELLPSSVFPFVMSALSGYPMGAKVVGDMYRKGIIGQRDVMRLMSYCSTSGPVFMIGAVGVGMLGSQEAGFVIAISHYSAAIINGTIYCKLIRSEHIYIQCEKRLNDYNIMEVLTGAIFAAFKSMAVILAYIIFFMFVMDLFERMDFFEIVKFEPLKVLMKGFVEMTVGCNALSGTSINLIWKSIIASLVISWGSLSILGQSMSMLGGTGIKFGYLILTKLTHSIFAGIIALFIGNVML